MYIRNSLYLDFFSFMFPGLKHVSDTQKTHKNPALRGQNPAVRAGPKPFSPSSKATAAAPSANTPPPVFERDGKKWKVVSCWFTPPPKKC